MIKLLAIAFSGITATAWVSTHAGVVNNKDSLLWLKEYAVAFKKNNAEDEETKGEDKSIEGLAINIKWTKSDSGGQDRKDIIGKCLSNIKDNSDKKFWESLTESMWLKNVLEELQKKDKTKQFKEIDDSKWKEETDYIKKSFEKNDWVKSLSIILTRCVVEDESYKSIWEEVKKILGNMDDDNWERGSWESSDNQERSKLRWLIAVKDKGQDPFEEIKGDSESDNWKPDDSEICSWTPKDNQEYLPAPQEVKLWYLWKNQNTQEQCYVRAGKFTY